MSHHAALESTQTCADGRTPGSSSSVPSGSPISPGRSRKKVTSVEPHTRQNVRCSPREDSYFDSRLAPVSHRNAAVGTATLVRNAAPVAFRHMEQWQLTTCPKGPSTSYWIPPQRQLPLT